jgi:2-polyprenyl-3-methyl-5-hydroxy-6-metoxy-1,4-benzoquinol methylase
LGCQVAREKDLVFQNRFGATKRNFGFQWLRYEVTDEDEDFRVFLMKTDCEKKYFEKKVVLEGGCGMGRYVRIASRMGAEVVGIDLSGAVTRAYRENRESPLVHIVQGNLMEIPFRKGSFDFVYSIGVLHHTPDTHDAFRQIAGLVKPSGKCAISVYGKVHPVAEFTWKMYRKILHKLPLRLVHYLCYIAVPKGFIDSWLQRHRITRKLGAISQCLLPVSPHPKWQVRLCDTFDWYMPQYQRYHTYGEVTDWFRGCGFSEVKELRNEVWPVNVTGVR